MNYIKQSCIACVLISFQAFYPADSAGLQAPASMTSETPVLDLANELVLQIRKKKGLNGDGQHRRKPSVFLTEEDLRFFAEQEEAKRSMARLNARIKAASR